MFPLNKELARKSTSLLQADAKQALENILNYWEAHLTNQISADLSGEDLKVLAAKLDTLRNLKKFEQVIRQHAS